MLAIALSLLNNKWKLLVIGLAVASVFFAGRMSATTAQAKHEVKTMEKANAIRNKVNSLPDSDIDERMRKWER